VEKEHCQVTRARIRLRHTEYLDFGNPEHMKFGFLGIKILKGSGLSIGDQITAIDLVQE
jgi:hypothetical protein